ncbi:MAG: hypothetical protein NTZ44_03025 [Candidatus Nomurabacteria bacterium]|nr:hypothetical protein [Candidatus Nomurabacteria bacterium]
MEHQSESKICFNCKGSFTIAPEDFGFYEKIGVPTPTLCWQCRYQRRIAGRNEWVLYLRHCSKCDKKAVSIYNPDYLGSVFCLECFWGDDWDRTAAGVDFDFSRPFFEQFAELRERAPKPAVAQFRCLNSPYTNQSQDLKNCYMCFACDASEDCMYGNWYFSCKQSIDCSIVNKSELLYECLVSSTCFKSTYLVDCKSCIDSHFLKKCRDCQNCFGCVNLRNKSYCWENVQLTKEEYFKKLSEFEWSVENIEKTRRHLNELFLKYPNKNYEGRDIVNATGDYIYHLKNCQVCFSTHKSEDVSYSQDASDMKGGRDNTEAAYNEMDYESEGIGYTANNISISRCWNMYNSMYSMNCFSCDNCFGCVGLNKQKYCIFNKQYTPEEYLVLKNKIIEHMKKTGEWGNFFPIEISLFAYNETVAQEYFPMNKEEILAKRWKWYDRGDRDYKVTVKSNELPKTIIETPDSILEEVISCNSHETGADKTSYFNCTTAFRVSADELSFYRRMNLPIPHKCFMCRFQDRLRLRNPRNLWHRKCMKEGCENEFETSYSPENPEIVYCEKCYQNEVY